MANISDVVVVTVTKTTAAIDRAAFGTPMGVFQVDTGIQAGRFQLYGSVLEMTDAGFPVSHEAVKWAGIVKSQNPAPQRFGIGRRGTGTAQVDTVTITAADAGTWSISIDAVVFPYIASASDTTQTIAQGLRDAVNDGNPSIVDVLVSTVTAGVFTVTARVAGTIFVNGGIVLGGAGTGTFVNTVANVAAEDMATALTAINTANSKNWFIATIESREDADITALNTFIGPLDKVAVAQSSDADAKAGTPSNIFDTIAALNNTAMNMYWHDDDREYLDGGVAGILGAADLDAAGGVITLHGKQVVGVPADDLTTAEINNIAGDGETNNGFGGNVHVEIASRGFIMYGKSAEGEFTDVETTILWTKARVGEAVFGLIATTPTKIPYTNSGINQVVTAVQGVMNTGVTNGHFDGDTPPTTTAPAIADIPIADKNARVLRNVVANARLAGAIHKAFIQVNVTV